MLGASYIEIILYNEGIRITNDNYLNSIDLRRLVNQCNMKAAILACLWIFMR